MYTAEKVRIGGKGCVRSIELGGDASIAIQTMWKQPLCEDTLQETVRQIAELEQLGCDILRFAVPDSESAEMFVKLTGMTPMPLVADIHFDYRLALRCMDGCAAKIRINPGNIGTEERVNAVIKKALFPPIYETGWSRKSVKDVMRRRRGQPHWLLGHSEKRRCSISMTLRNILCR